MKKVCMQAHRASLSMKRCFASPTVKFAMTAFVGSVIAILVVSLTA
ncbi:MAG: hypothetical protein K6E57_08705 [Fibrobacter sp.]|nr:hypothetical protein [Fibrobacter sp.]SHI29237.1 hypothetical protein SAMN05720471_10130 [Fibrobacter sp. UWP2]